MDQKDYLEMLTYKRPADSRTERQFIRKYLLSLDGAQQDAFGNVHVARGAARGLFSAHTDTMHRTSGRQRVTVGKDGCVRVDADQGMPRTAECLGADDASGIYILLRMIEAGVEGYYVFHRAEERGGLGSAWLAEAWQASKTPPTFAFAVAFDRRGLGDVITHQSWGRCCSDSFAMDLAERLDVGPGEVFYSPSDRGIFTDTANYVDMVGECTNVSVGYYNEHGPNERQDLAHLEWLASKACSLDWYALPQEREAGEIEYHFAESKRDPWLEGMNSSAMSGRDLDRIDAATGPHPCGETHSGFDRCDECEWLECSHCGYSEAASLRLCEWCGEANTTAQETCEACQGYMEYLNGLERRDTEETA